MTFSGGMPESSPVKVTVPKDGVVFAESIHARNFHMEERSEPFHKLLFLPSGRITLETPLGPMEGGPGNLWVVPAGARHRIVDFEPSVLLLLCIGRGFLQDDSLPFQLKVLFLGPITAQVENWWRHALLEGTQRALGQGAMQRAIALQILVSIARLKLSPNPSPRDRIRHLQQRVAETLYESWTLETAAAATTLSRRQFTKLFRAETGKSFLEFLTEKRLDYVENCLKSGRSTVTGAAFSAGFDDLSHFYRLFRRRTGLSPLAWLKQTAPRPSAG